MTIGHTTKLSYTHLSLTTSQHDLSSAVHATELSSYLASANSQAANNEVALELFCTYSDVVYVSVTI